MKTNRAALHTERTHEGGMARSPKGISQLERQVASCMLFESGFYESGDEIAKSIAKQCETVEPAEIARLAIKARNEFKLRHVPLFLLAQLDKQRTKDVGLVKRTVYDVVQRPDEMGELLSIIQKVNDKKPLKKVLSAQVKKGLAAAFTKWNGYSLAKWNRAEAIKLKDILFLVHAKPKDEGQAKLWKSLVDGTLEAADTWETALSAGADKKATWERLLAENKLGYMALLMNVRNMADAGVSKTLVEKALFDGVKGSRALPFRFVSAAKAAPSFAQAISDAMLEAIDPTPLAGSTAVVIDVSGSMDAMLSAKGTLARWEAAAALAVLVREVCAEVRVFTFSEHLKEVSNYRGLPLIDHVGRSQYHSGTYLRDSLATMFKGYTPDRVIVVTDEQTHDGILPLPKGTKGYLVNVAPYAPGLEVSGGWTRVNGFSERILDYIRYEESAHE